jgi:hypothetical protein
MEVVNMAKTLSKNEIAALIADHKTGQFSQRELARRYNISPAYVNKVVKNIPKEDEELVNAGIAYRTALAQRDEQSVNAIENIVNEKTKHLQFLHNATLKNISVMVKKLNEEATVKDHLDAQNAIHKAGQTLGVIDQFAKSGDVNVNATAAVQNNNITVEFVD